MKFILNTAVDPHFCAVFSESGERVGYHEWSDRRLDGDELWNFLRDWNVRDFTFIGGVSGPGGFSSLRVGAGVLNSLAFSLDMEVHAVGAMSWMEKMIEGQFDGGVVGVLNSFGDGVWLSREDGLVRYGVDDAAVMLKDSRVCVSWLPEEKGGKFENGVRLDMKNASEILLDVLEKGNAHRQFAVEYEVPAV